MAPDWIQVSAQRPCPICRKSKWCSISKDERAAVCRKKSDDPATPGWTCRGPNTDTNGQTYWLWQNNLRAAEELSPPSGASSATAPPKLLHAVYETFPNQLPLSRRPWQNLQKRGVSRPEIRKRQYGFLLQTQRRKIIQSVLDAGLEAHLSDVPGFYEDRSGRWRLAGPEGPVIPVRNLHGEIVAIKIRVERPQGSNKYLYLSSRKQGGASPGSPVHVPMHDAVTSTKTIRITEGELKADVGTAHTGILTLGLPGVQSFAKALPELRQLSPQKLLIAFDADFRTNPAVAKALVEAVQLYQHHFNVAVETWETNHGKGIDDVLARGKPVKSLSGRKLNQLIEKLARKFAPDWSNEPVDVEITTHEHLVNELAASALAKDPILFQRAGLLVTLQKETPKPEKIFRPLGVPYIKPVPKPVLRERLTRACRFKVWKDDELVPAHPPAWCVDALFSRGTWPGLRVLEGVATGPILRSDGTIQTRAGYDPETGLCCELDIALPGLPDAPTRKQAEAAADVLRQAVVDFPLEQKVHLATQVARWTFCSSGKWAARRHSRSHRHRPPDTPHGLRDRGRGTAEADYLAGALGRRAGAAGQHQRNAGRGCPGGRPYFGPLERSGARPLGNGGPATRRHLGGDREQCRSGSRHAQALAAHLKHKLGASYQKISDFFESVFGFVTRPSTWGRGGSRLAKKLNPTVAELWRQLRSSDVTHIDETGWRIRRQDWWLWVFCNQEITLFDIAPCRGHKVVIENLGKDYAGITVWDGLAGYDLLPWARQRCHAHLLKRIAGLQEQFGEQESLFWEQDQLTDLRQLLDDSAELKLSREEISARSYRSGVQQLRGRLSAWLELNTAGWSFPQERAQDHPAFVKLVRHVQRHASEWLRFLSHDFLDRTNNLGERQIRWGVITRKVGGCNQSSSGAWKTRQLASVLATCAQQGRSFLALVDRVLHSRAPTTVLLNTLPVCG